MKVPFDDNGNMLSYPEFWRMKNDYGIKYLRGE